MSDLMHLDKNIGRSGKGCPQILGIRVGCTITNKVPRSSRPSNFGINMDGNGIPVADVVVETSVRANGDGRACARTTVLDPVNDVAVRSGRKAGLESRSPVLIGVVDDNEPCLSSSEGDTLGRGRNPVGDIFSLDSVPEADHSRDGGPAMLAVPAVGSPVTATSTGVSVGSTRITIAKLVARQHGRRTEGVCQDPHMSKRVHVICGTWCQSRAVTFGIVVDDEGVG